LSGKTNYIWYKKGMKRVVNHFKKSFPNTSILLVSVADKSTKTESGEMQTDPAIPLIVEMQRETALETEVAFFNLYEKMGGENSMVKWAEELGFANKDYTHFNQKGAEAAASLLYDFLIKEYTIFKTSTQKKNDI
jgi:lysophospholipase L1-like esterase